MSDFSGRILKHKAFIWIRSSLFVKHKGFFGAEVRASAAGDTFRVIDYGSVKALLRQRAYRANFYRGASVVLRTVFRFDNKLFVHINLLIRKWIVIIISLTHANRNRNQQLGQKNCPIRCVSSKKVGILVTLMGFVPSEAQGERA